MCMKNVKFWYVLVLFLLYMVVCFSMPTLIIGNINSTRLGDEKIVDENFMSGDRFIKLLLTEKNEVVNLSLEDYLKGVLVGEVPVSYEIEALKAQAVVARTYTLYKLQNAKSKHEFDADMCDDINCCQAYKTKEYAFECWDEITENEKWSKFEEAVCSTSGEVILYSGDLINAFFHAHSGGRTENVKYLWSKEEIPYLVSVEGNEGSIRQDSMTFSKSEFKDIIKDKVPDFENDSKIIIKDYTGSGRINNLIIGDVIMEATVLRNLTGIKSTNFRIEESGDNITFYTVGYGHGVGMSQEGANQMAIDGNSHIEIIKHYYTGVEVSKMYF